VLLCSPFPGRFRRPGPLGREDLRGRNRREGEERGDKDTLIFKDGNFHSTGCDQYGFGDGAYTTTVKGDAIQFEAVTTSPTKGK